MAMVCARCGDTMDEVNLLHERVRHIVYAHWIIEYNDSDLNPHIIVHSAGKYTLKIIKFHTQLPSKTV